MNPLSVYSRGFLPPLTIFMVLGEGATVSIMSPQGQGPLWSVHPVEVYYTTVGLFTFATWRHAGWSGGTP